MRLGRNVKIGIGVATWLVASIGSASLVLGVCVFGSALLGVQWLPPLLLEPAAALMLMPAVRLGLNLLGAVYLGLTIFYLVYLVTTRRMRLMKKLAWGAGIWLLGWILLPLFFHVYIWPTREEFLRQRNATH